MKNTELLAVVAKNVDFNNELKNGERIQIGFGYQYNVKYSPNGTCRGEFTAKAENKSDPKAFHIIATLMGNFRITNPDVTKQELHVETYNEMFPYVRAFISTLTGLAGIPPVVAKYIDISGSDIYQFNMEELNRQVDDLKNHRLEEDGDE